MHFDRGMNEMIVFDAHCDTALRLFEDKKDLLNSDCHVDLTRMKKAGKFVQTFALFVDPSASKSVEMRKASNILDELLCQINSYGNDIALCRNHGEIIDTIEAGKVAALISIENGGALQGDMAALRNFFRLGVRSICLTWNNRNEIADGVKEAISGGGLTPFGRDVVAEMNRLGMLVDISHISEKGFWDVMEVSKAPVIASHSNAWVVCGHNRNLKDDQINALKSKGGVIGINLYPSFLNNTGNASVEDVIKHVEYISALAGPEYIGLGADFDGIESTPEDLNGVEDLYRIFDRLSSLNYSQNFIEGFAGENFLRVIKEVLK